MNIEKCPFCGGEAIVVKTERCGRYIGCWDCGGRTEEFETDYAGSAHDKAIAAWNRRAAAVPVVRGEWICNPDDKKFSLVCSVCGQVMPFVPEYLPDNPPFCNCGADMRRESEVKQ